jgi:hypothetical protein
LIYKQGNSTARYNASVLVDDQENQRSDKSKTCDLARAQYSHTKSVMCVDTDELLFCPNAKSGKNNQKKYQYELLSAFTKSSHDEIEFPRKIHCPTTLENNKYNSVCVNSGFQKKNITEMLMCWTDVTYTDPFLGKAASKGECPFSYIHVSCEKHWAKRWYCTNAFIILALNL